eukprot:6670628-Ditylum_brightwellii.AAC.1
MWKSVEDEAIPITTQARQKYWCYWCISVHHWRKDHYLLKALDLEQGIILTSFAAWVPTGLYNLEEKN